MSDLLTAFTTEGYQFALYAWDKAPTGDYGVISIEDGDDLMADGHHIERGTNLLVDYFTRDATDTIRTSLEAILEDEDTAWNLRSVQFESDTGYIHYEWSVGIYG